MDWNTTAQSLANCTSSTPSTSILDFTYGYNLGVSDNGNLASWSATGQQTFNRSFSYDSLNRISAMSQTSGAAVGCGSTYSISWNIDPWGNRSSQTFTGGSGQAPCVGSTTTPDLNNRLTGYPYDTAGNLLADASYQYQYDAENHLTMVIPSNATFGDCSTATACYFYNAEGQRIAKYTLGGTLTTFYIYGTNGEIVADTDGNLNWNDTYIHFGGQLIAQYRGSNTGFLISDHLGSTRLDTITPYSGSQSVYDNMDYLPFGEQVAGASSTTHKFTSKERDDETNPLANGNIGLDNFGARYNSSSFGRFMSPDPDNVSGLMNQDDPQTWNAYSYVRNNPLHYTDPDGQDVLVCIQGQDKCHRYTDDQWRRLYDKQNGQQGINLPGGNFPNGDITCGGQKCGSARYFDPGLESDDAVNFAIGGLFKTAIEGATTFLEGLFGGGARTVAGEAAASTSEGAYGTASRIKNLNGLSREEADAALKAENPVKVHTTRGGYTQYKYEDGSSVWVRPNGEVVRVPAPSTAPPGSRIDPSGNLTDAHNTGETIRH